MFHDLDVCAPPTPETLQALHALGYKTAAFSTTVTSKTVQAPQLPEHASLKLLTRATILLSEPSQLPLLSAQNLTQFDLVAVRPATEKLLQAALNADVDIITLPLEKRAAFRIRRAHIHVAQSKGVRFELCYAAALRESRRNFFANAAALVGITAGKSLLLSSGAASHMDLRGVHDVINLAGLFDLNVERARETIASGAADVVKRGDIRARCHKGVVRISVGGEHRMEE